MFFASRDVMLTS